MALLNRLALLQERGDPCGICKATNLVRGYGIEIR
jgi:hypothetical protein